ncbi:MAG: MOSC domain-containing protein, partial [Mycobacteriales bacterium]
MTATATVAEISRCPVKSMLGEQLPIADLTESGIAGDRAWALVDTETGKIASAKRPQLWGGLLALRATYPDGQDGHDQVRIVAGDGRVLSSSDPDIGASLSALVGRAVRLESAPDAGGTYEEQWPDIDGMAPATFLDDTRSGRSADGEVISSLPIGMLAPGTYQDVAPITLMTTASLRAAAALYPSGSWDPRRFRSSILIDHPGDEFAEQDWVGRTLHIGTAVLSVFAPTPRCVMITLDQQDLPGDVGLLRTLAKHNRVEVAGTGRFA